MKTQDVYEPTSLRLQIKYLWCGVGTHMHVFMEGWDPVCVGMHMQAPEDNTEYH